MTRPVSSAVEAGKVLSKLSRPQNIVYSGALACFTAYISGANLLQIIGLYLLILLLYAVATAYNNAADQRTDALNRRSDIVMPNRRLLRSFVAVCIGSMVLVQPLFAQPATALLSGVYTALLVAYSHPRLRVMARGYMASTLLCICYGILPYWLGAAQGHAFSDKQLIAMALLQFWLLLPIVLAKDYKDIIGDTATGKLTPLVRYGAEHVRTIAIASATIGAGLYVLFAASIHLAAWLYVPCAAAYVLLVHLLHVSKGRISKGQKNSITVVLLLMSLGLLAAV